MLHGSGALLCCPRLLIKMMGWTFSLCLWPLAIPPLLSFFLSLFLFSSLTATFLRFRLPPPPSSSLPACMPKLVLPLYPCFSLVLLLTWSLFPLWFSLHGDRALCLLRCCMRCFTNLCLCACGFLPSTAGAQI